jgi:hypothetical protein
MKRIPFLNNPDVGRGKRRHHGLVASRFLITDASGTKAEAVVTTENESALRNC